MSSSAGTDTIVFFQASGLGWFGGVLWNWFFEEVEDDDGGLVTL